MIELYRIEKLRWRLIRVCDICGKRTETEFPDEEYASEKLKEGGWEVVHKYINHRAHYFHLCCQECRKKWVEEQIDKKLIDSMVEHILMDFAYAYTNIDPLVGTKKLPVKLKWALQSLKPEVIAKFNVIWPHSLTTFLDGCATLWEDDFGIPRIALKKLLNELEPVIKDKLVKGVACDKKELIDT